MKWYVINIDGERLAVLSSSLRKAKDVAFDAWLEMHEPEPSIDVELAGLSEDEIEDFLHSNSNVWVV